MKLSQIATIIPLIIVAIGLIGWILTVRNDVTATINQVVGIHEEISGIHERINTEGANFNSNLDERFREAMDRNNKLHEQVIGLEKSLAIANDQMQTIMGDHMGFADVLRELGESGALPSGERRSYGGYGN
jgi:SMC interacting uncharacterized protein involved in chromosome segregation